MTSRFLASLLCVCLVAVSFADGKGAEVLKALNDFRAGTYLEAQRKAKTPDKIDLTAIEAAVKAKAEAATKGVEPGKVPASEALDWTEVFLLAGKPKEAQAILTAFIATKPAAKPLYEARTLFIRASWLAKDDKAVVSGLRSLEGFDPGSSVDAASLTLVYAPRVIGELGLDDAAGLIDNSLSLVKAEELTPGLKQRFSAISRRALDTKIDLYKRAGKMDKALHIVDDAIKNAPDTLRPALTLERNQMTLVGLAAPDIKGDKGVGKFAGLAALKGKVVIIDFFGAWCPPCLKEFADLNRAFADLQSKGLEIVGVTQAYGYLTDATKKMIPEAELKGLGELLKTQGVAWPVVFGSAENFSTYGVAAVPAIVVVGRDGIVRSLDVGYSPEGWQAIRKRVESLLAAKN